MIRTEWRRALDNPAKASPLGLAAAGFISALTWVTLMGRDGMLIHCATFGIQNGERS
jgi:hypothetical protein